MSRDSWQCQGREDHGYFGSGTCPHADDGKIAPCTNCLNAASDRAIEAAIRFMPPAVAGMFRSWLAQDRGRAVLHQAVQKIAALGGVDRASFRRVAQWTQDTGEDVRGMVRNVVANAKNAVEVTVDKAGALLAKQLQEHGTIFLGGLAKVAGALAGGEAQGRPDSVGGAGGTQLAQNTPSSKMPGGEARQQNTGTSLTTTTLTPAQQQQAAAAYAEKTTQTPAEAKALASVIQNRIDSGKSEFVHNGSVINSRDLQGVGGRNYNDYMRGDATGTGAQNATDALRYVLTEGPTTNATFFIVRPGGAPPTSQMLHNLGDVLPGHPPRVGDVFLFVPAPNH